MNIPPDSKKPLVFAFLATLLLGWLILSVPPESPSFNSENAEFNAPNNELVIIQGNALLSISPVAFPRTQVLGVVVAEENKETIEKIIFCESSGRHYDRNGNLLVGDLNHRHQAFGILQFQKRTFLWLASKSERDDLSIHNEQDQIWLFDWAISNNFGYLWTCYNKLKK